MNKKAVIDRMTESGVLPVFRTDAVKNLIPAGRAIGEAGIGCIEYTLTMLDALGLIRKARKELPKTMLIGMGTVMDGKTFEKAVRAGAQIITCLTNGLDADAYRTGRVQAITRVARKWVAAVRGARSAA